MTTLSNPAASEEARRRYIDSEFNALNDTSTLRLKVSSDEGATKWLSISSVHADRIREILKELK